MRVLGEACLLISLVATGYSAFLSLWRSKHGQLPPDQAAFRVACLGLAALSLTIVVLAIALVSRDFRFEYVAQYASRELPWRYCLSALWVGQAGSLLLWAWMMSGIAILLRITPFPNRSLCNTASGLVLANVCFLVTVMVFAADPMAKNVLAPNEGAGLSPLLQHPSMLIHPPIVFLAYAAWSVPCALALAALSSGRLDTTWIEAARPWALAGWTLLGSGLLIGAHWAYQELGWGGYWGWDPVENGSLLPWLTGTALVHGMLVWRHRECMKKVTLSLAIATFALCNFATFLTRSGIFSSVHAFSESPIGWMFLVLMSALAVGGAWLVVRQRRNLRSRMQASSLVARENLIAVSMFLILVLTTVVMIGTLVAPVSKLVTGRMIQVGAEFYNNVLPPIGLAVLAMTAAVPLLRWGRPPGAPERRLLAACIVISGVVAVCGGLVADWHPLTISAVALAILTIATPAAAAINSARRRLSRTTLTVVLSTVVNGRRKYAAYAIHLGLALVAVGVAGSSLGTQRMEVELSEGETIDWLNRRIHYVQLVQSQLPDKLVAEAVLEIARGGTTPVVLRPARHLHLLQNEWTTEVAIHSTWSGDFYTVLHAGLGEGRVSLTLVDNPMIRWIWFGGILSTVSAIVNALPSWHRRRREMDTSLRQIQHDIAQPTASAA